AARSSCGDPIVFRPIWLAATDLNQSPRYTDLYIACISRDAILSFYSIQRARVTTPRHGRLDWARLPESLTVGHNTHQRPGRGCAGALAKLLPAGRYLIARL